MALGIFLAGLDTVDDVLTIRANAISQLAAGGTVLVQWSSEGTSVTKIQGISLRVIIEECNNFLRSEDPATYGRKITRTRPFYN